MFLTKFNNLRHDLFTTMNTIKSHFLQLMTATVMTAVAAGCAEESMVAPVITADDGAITLEYEISEEMTLSRGVDTETHETKLEKVYVLFFDSGNDEIFVGYKAVDVQPGKKRFSFDPPEGLSHNRDYRLLAVGNADLYSENGDFTRQLKSFSGNYEEALNNLVLTRDGAVTSGKPGLLPMWGNYVDDNGDETRFSTAPGEEEGQITVTGEGHFFFSRSICRFDLHNLVGNKLKVACARVVNARNATLIFKDGINKGSQPEFTPLSAPDGEGYMPVTTDMVPGENTTQKLEYSLYAFPNINGTSVVNDKTTTALMIAGYWFDEEKKEYEGKLTYYRFNIANGGECQTLARNYCYRATIKGVRRRGADDEKTAYNDSSPIFDYEIDDEWDATDDNVVTDKDGNFLIVNRSHFTFPGDKSEADNIELRVSTNPGLTWELKWDDTQLGNANNYFSYERLSNQAVKLGTKQINDEPYLRYGYLKIIATNPNTGATLTLPIYLTQLSIKNQVKTLTVDGRTGTFDLDLDPMGGTVTLQVVTGSVDNAWKAVDDGNQLSNWDSQGISFTKSGGNKTYLEITVPANISGAQRTAALIVSLAENTFNDDGTKKVPDVTINLIQDKSSQLMDVINLPSSGSIDINCLSFKYGNPNGVVNPMSFTVRLTDARYRFRVTSDFDKDRDLVLSVGSNRAIGTTHASGPATATHPANNADGTVVVNKDDKLEDLTHNTTFWINPFRTGPEDPSITGTITVEAYCPDNPELPTETKSFTVKLNSEGAELNDVIFNESGTYYIFPDRNFGAPPRIAASGSESKGRYYDDRTNVSITNSYKPSDQGSLEMGGYRGTACMTSISRLDNTIKTHTVVENYNCTDIVESWVESNSNNNDLYKSNAIWSIPNKDFCAILNSRLCISKERPYIISDFITKDGTRYCCWIPYFTSKIYTLEGCHYLVNPPHEQSVESSSDNVFYYSMQINISDVEIKDAKSGETTYSAWARQESTGLWSARPIATLTSEEDIAKCRQIYNLSN